MDERDGRRAGQVVGQLLVWAARDGEAYQRVLIDLVVAARRAEPLAKLGQLGDGEAAVLGDDGAGGVVQALSHLIDDRHLLRSGVLHRFSAFTRRPRTPVDDGPTGPVRAADRFGSPRQAGSLEPLGHPGVHRRSTALLRSWRRNVPGGRTDLGTLAEGAGPAVSRPEPALVRALGRAPGQCGCPGP